MPLLPGSSNAAKSENIRREMAAGKPQRQAIAIALDNARRTGGAKKVGVEKARTKKVGVKRG